ncbi:hypothetical protein AMS68_000732 [Peltaster fructicola]|uniref:Uncharacterized protein n=1 Tax=Peltaster fructicola TaxID=286661 RepID=A0A6H0XKR6_9PEZI|nr:hypothetical protein AMS68_000732 [Peltaster fructicola]
MPCATAASSGFCSRIARICIRKSLEKQCGCLDGSKAYNVIANSDVVLFAARHPMGSAFLGQIPRSFVPLQQHIKQIVNVVDA